MSAGPSRAGAVVGLCWLNDRMAISPITLSTVERNVDVEVSMGCTGWDFAALGRRLRQPIPSICREVCMFTSVSRLRLGSP